jgi:putative toxin-antitoxin system antitoxin component (TIGR02293 family)
MSAASIGQATSFWPTLRGHKSPGQHRSVFEALVQEVLATSPIDLYDAIEVGVPTYMVDVIAAATGEPAADVMEFIGVSQTTLRRKVDAGEPLPDVAGHRVMAFLRVAATLRRLLDESGDPEQLADFDMEGWLAQWMRQALPEFGGKSPAEMLRNPEGQRAVEQVLERMRGGLPA